MAYVADLKRGSDAWAGLRDTATRALTAIWVAIRTAQERRAQRIIAQYRRDFQL